MLVAVQFVKLVLAIVEFKMFESAIDELEIVELVIVVEPVKLFIAPEVVA